MQVNEDEDCYINISNAFLPATNLGTTPTTFEVGYEYNINFACVDKSKIVVYSSTFILNSGIPCVDKIQNSDGSYSVGINKLADPNYALDVQGKVNFESININNKELIDVLYENTSGNYGTITLNNSVSNYKYIEIFYAKNSDSIYQSVKIFNPNGKKASLDFAYRVRDDLAQLGAAYVSINNTTITWETNGRS